MLVLKKLPKYCLNLTRKIVTPLGSKGLNRRLKSSLPWKIRNCKTLEKDGNHYHIFSYLSIFYYLFIYLFTYLFTFHNTTWRGYVVGSFKVSTLLFFFLTNLSSTKHNTNNTQRRNCWLISKWKLEPASNNKNNCIKILFVNKSHHYCYNLVTCRIMWSVIGYSCCAMYDLSSLLRPH